MDNKDNSAPERIWLDQGLWFRREEFFNGPSEFAIEYIRADLTRSRPSVPQEEPRDWCEGNDCAHCTGVNCTCPHHAPQEIKCANCEQPIEGMPWKHLNGLRSCRNKEGIFNAEPAPSVPHDAVEVRQLLRDLAEFPFDPLMNENAPPSARIGLVGILRHMSARAAAALSALPEQPEGDDKEK